MFNIRIKTLFQLRLISLIVLSVLFFPVYVNGQTGKVKLDSGLVACYPFNGNANDESGNGYNGKVNLATLTTDRFGNPNSAYEYNGTTNYIDVSSIPVYQTATMSIWIYREDLLLNETIIGFDGSYVMHFYYNQSIDCWTKAGSVCNGAWPTQISSTSQIPLRQWTHVAWTKDINGEQKLYINGILEDDEILSTQFINSCNYGKYFGVAHNVNNQFLYYYKGRLDDIRIYKRALNQNEVEAIYKGNGCCSGNFPVVNLGKDTTLCSGCTIKLHAGKNFSSYQWQDGSTDSTYIVTVAGKYWVTVKNNSGCQGSDTILILKKDSNLLVTGDFEIPDTICINQSFNIINKSQGATNYYWNFCSIDIKSTPKGEFLTSQGNLSSPHFIKLVKEGNDYYTFSINHVSGTITRNYFGNSLRNTPVSVNIGFIANTLVGIEMKKDNGNWYGFVTTTPYDPTSSLIRLEFGSSLLNIPKIINLGNIGNLNRPHGIIIVQDSIGNWYGLTVNATGNTITEFKFGKSLANTPQTINLGNIGTLNYPTAINVWKENSNWYFFISNLNSNSFTRLDFGKSLLNTPKATNLGKLSYINAPDEVKFFKDCGGLHAFSINYGSSSISRIDFNNGITGSLTGVDYGNIGNLVSPVGITDLINFGDTLFAIIANRDNNTLSRIYIPLCTNPAIHSTNLMNPSPISYNKPGTYTISLTIDEGLITQNTICKTIVVTDSLMNLPVFYNYPVCEGGTLNLETNTIAGATYQWTGPNNFSSNLQNPSIQKISALSSGTYTLIVIAPKGCKNTLTNKIIIIHPNPKIYLGNDTSICQGSNLILRPHNDTVNYTWSDNSHNNILQVNKSGTYSVTITDKYGCTNADTINVSLNLGTTLNLGNDTTICKKKSIILNAGNPGSSFIWNTGDITQTILVSNSGKYMVTVSNGSCSSTGSIHISVDVSQKVNLGNDTTICPGTELILNPHNKNVSYTWNNKSTYDTIWVNKKGKYSVTITDKYGCTDTNSINVSIFPSSYLNLGNDKTICNGCSIVIDAGNKFKEYLWQNGAKDSTLTVITSGTYSVTATDEYGCKYTDSIIIFEDCDGQDLFIPNCFTPNGDNLDDMFQIVTSPCYTNYDMKIYNRWGALLFETNDISKGWDGKFNNHNVSEGVYIYILTYYNISNSNSKMRKQGTITLLR